MEVKSNYTEYKMQMARSIKTDSGEMIVKRVSVPLGLEELMEGLTKEVLLQKPKDIYVFAAEYFAKLLKIREKSGSKGNIVPIRKTQSVVKAVPSSVKENKRALSVDSKKSSLTKQKSIRPQNNKESPIPIKRNQVRKKSKDKSESSSGASTKSTPRNRSSDKSDESKEAIKVSGRKIKAQSVEYKEKNVKTIKNKAEVIAAIAPVIKSVVKDESKEVVNKEIVGCKMTDEKAVDLCSTEENDKIENKTIETDVENILKESTNLTLDKVKNELILEATAINTVNGLFEKNYAQTNEKIQAEEAQNSKNKNDNESNKSEPIAPKTDLNKSENMSDVNVEHSKVSNIEEKNNTNSEEIKSNVEMLKESKSSELSNLEESAKKPIEDSKDKNNEEKNSKINNPKSPSATLTQVAEKVISEDTVDAAKSQTTSSSFDLAKLQEELQETQKHAAFDTKSDKTKSGSENLSDAARELLAVIKIQSIWRGFLARRTKKSTAEIKDTKLPSLTSKKVAEKVVLEDTVDAVKSQSTSSSFELAKLQEQLQQTQKHASFDTKPDKTKTGSENLSDAVREVIAVTKIQSIWRGFLVRKTKKSKADKKIIQESTDKTTEKQKSENIQTKANNLKIKDIKSLSPTLKQIPKEVISKVKEPKIPNTSSSFDISKLQEELQEAEKHTPFDTKSEKPKLKSETLSDAAQELLAAIKIQSIWRGFLARKSLRTKRNTTTKATSILDIATAALTIQRVWRGFQIRKLKERGELFGTAINKAEIKTDAELLKSPEKRKNGAALKIQSLWRGYKVRKNVEDVTKHLKELQTPTECDEMPNQRDGHNINDSNIYKAASKIQAGYRGYLVRRKKRNARLAAISEEPINSASVNTSPSNLTKAMSMDASMRQLPKDKLKTNSLEFSDTLQDDDKINSIPIINNVSKTEKKSDGVNENREINESIPIDLLKTNGSASEPVITDGSILDNSVNNEISSSEKKFVYENAPTRPATTDKLDLSNENKQMENVGNDILHKSHGLNHENVIDEDQQVFNIISKGLVKENCDNMYANADNGDLLEKNDGKENRPLSLESNTSHDSVATVIFNDAENNLGGTTSKLGHDKDNFNVSDSQEVVGDGNKNSEGIEEKKLENQFENANKNKETLNDASVDTNVNVESNYCDDVKENAAERRNAQILEINETDVKSKNLQTVNIENKNIHDIKNESDVKPEDALATNNKPEKSLSVKKVNEITSSDSNNLKEIKTANNAEIRETTQEVDDNFTANTSEIRNENKDKSNEKNDDLIKNNVEIFEQDKLLEESKEENQNNVNTELNNTSIHDKTMAQIMDALKEHEKEEKTSFNINKLHSELENGQNSKAFVSSTEINNIKQENEIVKEEKVSDDKKIIKETDFNNTKPEIVVEKKNNIENFSKITQDKIENNGILKDTTNVEIKAAKKINNEETTIQSKENNAESILSLNNEITKHTNVDIKNKSPETAKEENNILENEIEQKIAENAEIDKSNKKLSNNDQVENTISINKEIAQQDIKVDNQSISENLDKNFKTEVSNKTTETNDKVNKVENLLILNKKTNKQNEVNIKSKVSEIAEKENDKILENQIEQKITENNTLNAEKTETNKSNEKGKNSTSNSDLNNIKIKNKNIDETNSKTETKTNDKDNKAKNLLDLNNKTSEITPKEFKATNEIIKNNTENEISIKEKENTITLENNLAKNNSNIIFSNKNIINKENNNQTNKNTSAESRNEIAEIDETQTNEVEEAVVDVEKTVKDFATTELVEPVNEKAKLLHEKNVDVNKQVPKVIDANKSDEDADDAIKNNHVNKTENETNTGVNDEISRKHGGNVDHDDVDKVTNAENEVGEKIVNNLSKKKVDDKQQEEIILDTGNKIESKVAETKLDEHQQAVSEINEETDAAAGKKEKVENKIDAKQLIIDNSNKNSAELNKQTVLEKEQEQIDNAKVDKKEPIKNNDNIPPADNSNGKVTEKNNVGKNSADPNLDQDTSKNTDKTIELPLENPQSNKLIESKADGKNEALKTDTQGNHNNKNANRSDTSHKIINVSTNQPHNLSISEINNLNKNSEATPMENTSSITPSPSHNLFNLENLRKEIENYTNNNDNNNNNESTKENCNLSNAAINADDEANKSNVKKINNGEIFDNVGNKFQAKEELIGDDNNSGEFYIPIRELSDIKEEESKTDENQTVSSTSNQSNDDEQSPVNLPISVTPPSRTRSRDGQCQTESPEVIHCGLLNTGELHDNVLPLSVQLNSDGSPAGSAILTSFMSDDSIKSGAQASSKDDDASATCEKNTAQPDIATAMPFSVMETEKRNNSSTLSSSSSVANNNKKADNMESEAATKIQAGFRGYQVRKQLKNKITAPGDISNQRRSARRKSSGRLTESNRANQQKGPKPSDLEEKSAVKIQAGVRGFLVRRRQKKQKGEGDDDE